MEKVKSNFLCISLSDLMQQKVFSGSLWVLLLSGSNIMANEISAGGENTLTASAQVESQSSQQPTTDLSTSPEPTLEKPPEKSCIPFATSLKINASAKLCSGTYQITHLDPGHGAIEITGENINFACEANTQLQGLQVYGEHSAVPSAGIYIHDVKNVNLTGCSLSGFRYGILVFNSENISLDGANLSNNFNDPSLEWVQDSVRGGGIRFEKVKGSSLINSQLAQNWNGVELRESSNITIKNNVGQKCANTGVIVIDSHYNIIENNDFSWAIRGKDLLFPSHWYGIDTRDSAGIILDDNSSFNQVNNNNFEYGGDGIFIRSIIGRCAVNNTFVGNKTSYSPHNAIECWCDGNQFIKNDASFSGYGLWLGGTDNGLVQENLVRHNQVDGISLQIAESRGNKIIDNLITNNGRTGILLSSRAIQSWENLVNKNKNFADASQTTIVGNKFSDNKKWDIYLTGTDFVILGKNARVKATGAVSIYKDSNVVNWWDLDTFKKPDISSVLTASTATSENKSQGIAPHKKNHHLSIVKPTVSSTGIFQLSVKGSPLDYLGFESRLVIRKAGPFFVEGEISPAIYKMDSTDVTEPQELVISNPGLYDVLFTLIGQGEVVFLREQIFVAPKSLLPLEAPTLTCVVTNELDSCSPSAMMVAKEPFLNALKVEVDSPNGTSIKFSLAAQNLTVVDLPLLKIGFFMSGENDNDFGWYKANPQVFIQDEQKNTVVYTPQTNILPLDPKEWIWVEIPLAGGAGWAKDGELVGALKSIGIKTSVLTHLKKILKDS